MKAVFKRIFGNKKKCKSSVYYTDNRGRDVQILNLSAKDTLRIMNMAELNHYKRRLDSESL